jgi:phage head maturation protease
VIRATFPAGGLCAAESAGARTVTGTAVPYGVPGQISDGRTVVFEPGSLDAAARPLLLRDHDRSRPLGRVTDAVDCGDRLDATARISGGAGRSFRDGDEALMLAADGVLAAFSVGADPTTYYTDDDDVLHVTAADWHELSLLTFGAYDTARVASVTATRGELPTMSDEPATPPPDEPDPDTEPNPDIEPDPVTAGATVVPIAAGRHPSGRTPEVTLRTLGRLFTDARAGNRRAEQQLQTILRRYTVEAALADVTMVGTDNVGGMVRPGYQPEIVDIVSHGAPMTEVIRQGDLQRGDFPNKTFLRWTKTPTVALQSAEKVAINSTPVALAPASVPVKTWATGNDISQQTLDFGPPSFVEEYVRAAAVSYAKVIDTYAVTALLAAATAATTAIADPFTTLIQKMFAVLDPANVPSGQLFLAVPWSAAAGLIGVTAQNAPAYWSMTIDIGSFVPDTNVAGLPTIIDPNLPANTYLLGMTSAATWYDTPGVPYTLQALNVGQLGLDLAVYGYGALGVQYPAALVKTTPV